MLNFREYTASRREMLAGAGAAAAALVIGFRLGGGAAAAQGSADFAPNAFLRIALDSTVTVIAKHIEFGQGVMTGLATIVAEELDADWAQVAVEFAPANGALYANHAFGSQGTGGSTSIANSWNELRQAGAQARAALVGAAATRWGVPAGEIAIEGGRVTHAASGKSATFGQLVADAAATAANSASTTASNGQSEAVPKPISARRLIGTKLPRLDNADKIHGRAQYGIDMKLPGLLTALVARPPRFGAKLKSFDDSKAKAVPGVTDVVAVPRGLAVVATGFWAAKQGREALQIVWDDAGAETRGSAEMSAEYRALAATPGLPAKQRGAAGPALGSAAQVIDETYEFPYLAHAPMEPLNATVRLSEGLCEIWSGSQFPSLDQAIAAAIAGVPPEKVIIHTLLAGGSFGRRATPDADVINEAVSVAKAINGRAPVRLLWTREDDITGGRYRPAYVHQIKAGVNAQGKLSGWQHVIVGQSIIASTPFAESMIKDGIDSTSVEGAHNLPYTIADFDVSLHTTKSLVPVLWWRSVGHSHTAYAVETMIDQLAEAAGADPVAFRLAHLGEHPRHRAALMLAAEKANWNSTLPEGVARGVAVHESFGTVVAQVAEVRMDGETPRVLRVVAGVECGTAINPDVIAAQVEGGIGYGLSAFLHGAITLDTGAPEQSNFHDYPPLRIGEMPSVEVHVVPSAADPTGIGEPGVPPIAPAVANAIRRLTKVAVRTLPFAGTAGRA